MLSLNVSLCFAPCAFRFVFSLVIHRLQEQIDLFAVYTRETAKKRERMSRPGYCELCCKSYTDLGDVRLTIWSLDEM